MRERETVVERKKYEVKPLIQAADKAFVDWGTNLYCMFVVYCYYSYFLYFISPLKEINWSCCPYTCNNESHPFWETKRLHYRKTLREIQQNKQKIDPV